MELVKLLPVHRYSVDIFSYSGPSGKQGPDGKQNTAVLLKRRFSIFLKDPFFPDYLGVK